MIISHRIIWVVMAMVAFLSGALLRGQADILAEEAAARVLLHQPPVVLTAIELRSGEI